jgi:hypothetical protein
MILISLSVKTGFAARSCSAGLVHDSTAQAAPTAARATRIANRFFRSRPETVPALSPHFSMRHHV